MRPLKSNTQLKWISMHFRIIAFKEPFLLKLKLLLVNQKIYHCWSKSVCRNWWSQLRHVAPSLMWHTYFRSPYLQEEKNLMEYNPALLCQHLQCLHEMFLVVRSIALKDLDIWLVLHPICTLMWKPKWTTLIMFPFWTIDYWKDLYFVNTYPWYILHAFHNFMVIYKSNVWNCPSPGKAVKTYRGYFLFPCS